MRRQGDHFPSFSHTSKVIAMLSKNGKEKIQPSLADTTAKQTGGSKSQVQRGEKHVFGDFVLIFAAKLSGNECC